MAADQLLEVVAGILHDDAGRVLLGERLGEGAFAGLWEFPGGKLHAGETPFAALQRELREEIGVEVRAGRLFMTQRHDYPERRVAIDFYLVNDWCNVPRGIEGQSLRWCEPAKIEAAHLLPANAPVLRALRKLAYAD